MRQTAFIWMLRSDWNHPAFHRSTQYIQHGGKIESLWDRNCVNLGSEFIAEPGLCTFVFYCIKEKIRKRSSHYTCWHRSKPHTKAWPERFLIIENQAVFTFSKESSSSKPRTRQKQTAQFNWCRLGSSRKTSPRDWRISVKGVTQGRWRIK